MTTYTVQCGYATYYANTGQVEADSLDAALQKAIERANDDPHWKALDHCGPTAQVERDAKTRETRQIALRKRCPHPTINGRLVVARSIPDVASQVVVLQRRHIARGRRRIIKTEA